MPSVAKRYGAGAGAYGNGAGLRGGQGSGGAGGRGTGAGGRGTGAGARGAGAAPGGDELRAPVVLMVSGGADSTALLVLAATSALDIGDGRGPARIARERLHVLHVNHQLRGIDAQEDEEYVRELAAHYGIPCTVRRADVAALAASSDGNVENAGRELRYAAAAELANELSEQLGTPRSAARILTAHTADDRAETFFMNAMRGTGPAGLASIPRQRNRIVRPLLDRTHEELCDLLRMRGLVWREDDTNRDTRYLRAYVRHEVMPVVRARNPRVSASLGATCDILSDEDAYLTQVAARAYRELTRREGPGMVALDAGRLAAAEVVIARRVVRRAILAVAPSARIEAQHVAAVLRLVAAGRGSAQVAEGVDVRVEYGLLFVRAGKRNVALGGSARGAASGRDGAAGGGLTAGGGAVGGIAPGSSGSAGKTDMALDGIGGWLEVPAPSEARTAPDAAGRLAVADGRVLVVRLTQVPRGADPVALARAHGQEWGGASVLLDAEAAGVDPARGGRLWVDAPAAGDVLCPLGMHGQSKKLSDLLNEAKIPAADRPRVPVVRTSPTGRVVWVAGVRADERAKCTPRTRQLLEFIYVPASALAERPGE